MKKRIVFYLCLLFFFAFSTSSSADDQLDLEIEFLEEKSSFYLKQVDHALNQYQSLDEIPEQAMEDVHVISDGFTPVYFSQLDERWCFEPFGTGTNGMIYHTGCGPTTAAMVVSSLKEYVTPDVIAKFGMEHGYNMGNNGSSWALFPAVARKYHLRYQQTATPQIAISCLEKGGLVIASQNNALGNYWTTSGHFILITGVYGDYFTVHDPSSKRNTETVHTYDEVFLPNKQLFLFYP